MESLTEYPDLVRYLLLGVPDGPGLRNIRALRLTCKAWRAAIPRPPSGFYENRVITAMREWGIADIADELCAALATSEGNATVSGSFVLRAVLGSDETWKPGDLDVFCNLEARQRLMELLKESGFSKLAYFARGDVDIRSANWSMWWYEKNPKSWSTYYQRNDRIIQLIAFEGCHPDALSDIVAAFDLTFCRLSFDGKKVTARDQTTWDDVLNKSTVAPKGLLPERCQKYQERQFCIVDDDDDRECKRIRTE